MIYLHQDYRTGKSSTKSSTIQPENGTSESETISISTMENSTSAKIIDGQKRSASPTVSIQIRKENDERYDRLQEELNTLKTMMRASLEQNTNISRQAGHGFQATISWMHASDTELLYFLPNWDRHELEPCLRLKNS